HEPSLAAAGGAHLGHLAAALAELVDHDAGEFLIDIDHCFLDRLQPLAGRRVLAIEHARAADRELEAFAAHGLDQHAELQFAAARDLEGVTAFRFLHLDRDVAFGLAHQARADHAAGHLVALAPRQRAVIDRE